MGMMMIIMTMILTIESYQSNLNSAKNSTVATPAIKSNDAKIKSEPKTTSTNNIDQAAKLKADCTEKINASKTMPGSSIDKVQAAKANVSKRAAKNGNKS